MGSLQHLWADKAVNIHSKYLIFCAIPVNLALWGCEIWAFRETLPKKLEVFFHRIIRRMLGIPFTQVINEHITNDSICMRSCHIPSIWHQIAKRRLHFIGKVVRNSNNQIPTHLLNARFDHPRRRVVPLQNDKNNLVLNIQLIVSSTARNGWLSSWVFYALDSSYWNHLISQLGTQPTAREGDTLHATENNNATPPPTNDPHPQSPLRQKTSSPPSSPCSSPSSPLVPSPPQHRRPPSAQRTSSQNNNEGDSNPNGTGRDRRNYIGILQLLINPTEREIKVQYWRLSRIYHPDKYDGSTNSTTKDQAQEHFKTINNA